MKILCDVHIAFKVLRFFQNNSIEAIHINHILDGDKTKDSDICKYADENSFIVLSKDADFQNSHFIKESPKKLIKVNLGNISNQLLIEILENQLPSLKEYAQNHEKFMIEINADFIRFIDENEE